MRCGALRSGAADARGIPCAGLWYGCYVMSLGHPKISGCGCLPTAFLSPNNEKTAEVRWKRDTSRHFRQLEIQPHRLCVSFLNSSPLGSATAVLPEPPVRTDISCPLVSRLISSLGLVLLLPELRPVPTQTYNKRSLLRLSFRPVRATVACLPDLTFRMNCARLGRPSHRSSRHPTPPSPRLAPEQAGSGAALSHASTQALSVSLSHSLAQLVSFRIPLLACLLACTHTPLPPSSSHLSSAKVFPGAAFSGTIKKYFPPPS